jgi:hypothetical protein
MFTKQCGHIISFNNFARFESPGFLQASAALPEASSLDSAGDQAPVVSSNGFFLFLIDSLAVWSANRRAVVIAVAARPDPADASAASGWTTRARISTKTAAISNWREAAGRDEHVLLAESAGI